MDMLYNSDIDSCKESHKEPIFILDDRKSGSKSSIRVINELREIFYVIKVDNCIEKLRKEQKCDYSIIYNKVWYIELKGCRIEDGLKQLKNTINLFSDLHRGYERIALLIVSRFSFPETKIQKWKKEMKKKAVELLIKTSPFELHLS